MILLDSDVAIDILRKRPPALAWISTIQVPVCLPGIVALELYQGCRDKREAADLESKIKPFAILWPSEQSSNIALNTFASAHLTHSLGILDALIAATALTHNLPLHTFNQKHFAAVPNLQTIQPYTR